MENLLRRLSSLRRATNKSGEKAPHKPVLLLSVIQLFEEGVLNENRIEITPELVATFEKLWVRLVPESRWQPRIYLPFYHLSTDKKKSDPIWFLQPLGGFDEMLTKSYSPKSLSALDAVVAFAFLSESLFAALLDPVSRNVIRTHLLEVYFPNRTFDDRVLIDERNQYLLEIESEFLGEKAQAAEDGEKYETRSAIFKQQVPKVYNFTCSISGLRVSSKSNVRMIDACHIQPWHLHHNDTIQNGICLTPTLHRAFDRGLISISEDYRVLVSDQFEEDKNSTYSLSQFRYKPLILPTNPKLAPSQKLIAWHRERFNFQS